MVSQFPPELVERGRALRSTSPPSPSRWKPRSDEDRWALATLMGEAVKDFPEEDRADVVGDFARDCGFRHNQLLHPSYVGQSWPLERRNPAKSYTQHERLNQKARKAQTEEDWAHIWDEPAPTRASSRAPSTESPDLSKASAAQLLERLQDPRTLRALRRLATDNKQARLEEARQIAERDQEDREKAAKREWARVDRERQRLEKLGANEPNDFFVQASTRLVRFPAEMAVIETMAEYMTPFMREKLLKLADDVVGEVQSAMAAVKNIDKIIALKARAARTEFEAEAAQAKAHADRLSNGRSRTQYGVHVNLSSDQGNQAPSELPTSSGKKTKPKS